jgi:hypothetical protein
MSVFLIVSKTVSEWMQRALCSGSILRGGGSGSRQAPVAKLQRGA